MNRYMFKTALMAGILWTALTATATASVWTKHLLNKTHCTAQGNSYFYLVDKHRILETYYSDLLPGWEAYYRSAERAFPIKITGYCKDKPEVTFKPYIFRKGDPIHWWFVIEETPGGPVIRPSAPWAKVNGLMKKEVKEDVGGQEGNV